MQALVLIAICAVGLIVFGGMVFIWALEQLAKIISFGDSIIRPPAAMLYGHVSRKTLNVRANVPQALEDFSTARPDPERVALKDYNPRAFEVPQLVEHQYHTGFGRYLNEPLPPTQRVDIASLPELLNFTNTRSYQPVLNFAKRVLPTYPEPPLTYPPAISPPPSWKPWVADETRIEFEIPVYTGWRSVLNGHVREAYKGEKKRYEQALHTQAEMREFYKKRNDELTQLHMSANARYNNAKSRSERNWEKAVAIDTQRRELFIRQFNEEQEQVLSIAKQLNSTDAQGLVARIEWSIRTLALPSYVSRESITKYDAESRILIHEHRFPDLGSLEFIKTVDLKSGRTAKPATQKEIKNTAPSIYPSLSIRLAAELLKLDTECLATAVVINGWADYTLKSTGQTKRAYCSSLFATREQIKSLNLSALDPVAAFAALKGVAARTLELTPILPILRLDTNDPRFVDSKEVLGKLSDGENLAAMEWEEFEHLCRELFERAFAGSGAEVKVTQASRDQGVDAIIFDPDPIRGGKIVVQAKRYTNIVDVSAVRDLYGSLINEGATKGILVTTSNYGPDSYGFAKDKPITLLNGSELLGLLQKYGYNFSINLEEAKRLNQQAEWIKRPRDSG